ncbi:unnamed protein product [Caenorhabditis brenneri]
MEEHLAGIIQDETRFDESSIRKFLKNLSTILNSEDLEQDMPDMKDCWILLMPILEDKRDEPKNQLLGSQCLIELYRRDTQGILTIQVKEVILKNMISTIRGFPKWLNAGHKQHYRMTVGLLKFLANFNNTALWPEIFSLFCDFFWNQHGMEDEIFCLCCKIFKQNFNDIDKAVLEQIREHYLKTIFCITPSTEPMEETLVLGFQLALGTNTDDFLGTCIYFFTDRTDRWQQYLPYVSFMWAGASEKAREEFLFPNLTAAFMKHLFSGETERLETMEFLVGLFNGSRKDRQKAIHVENNAKKLSNLFVLICDDLRRSMGDLNYYQWKDPRNQMLPLECFKKIQEKAEEIAPEKQETFAVFLNWMLRGMKKLEKNEIIS